MAKTTKKVTPKPVAARLADAANVKAEDVRAIREAAGLTQQQCADLVYLGAPQRWAEYELGTRHPDVARWTLFLLRIGRHPEFLLSARAAKA